jgi:hypothetical protein
MLDLSRLLCHQNVFALVQNVAPLCLQWLLAQLFLPAWAGGTGHCSVYLSLMSIETSSLASKKNYQSYQITPPVANIINFLRP